MPRLALKPDPSFFRKIALGAVGTRSVIADLGPHGHRIVELERGSTDTKLWKEVKRKRVRIPDLVCLLCGHRLESRAKTEPHLSLSHSKTEAERAWDFGMVDSDWIAFPVCVAIKEYDWSAGRLGIPWSYWRGRSWVRWEPQGVINYFAVEAFRSTPHSRTTTKGVTEGSETTLTWDAIFSSRTGVVDSIERRRVRIRRTSDGHAHTWNIPAELDMRVGVGENVQENQVIASVVSPVTAERLRCPERLPERYVSRLIESRERTQRFTGVKLARLLGEPEYRDAITRLADDREEDVYVRLEGASYLVSIGARSARDGFGPYLNSSDDQTRLESVIALAETSAPEAVQLLGEILDDRARPYFLRSAAAWSLSKVRNDEATRRLVRAFADVDWGIREEALEGIISVGGPGIPILLDGLEQVDANVAAGCAEALRQQQSGFDAGTIARLLDQLRLQPSQWAVWLVAHLPQEHVAATIAELEQGAPQLHYAVTLLWAFIRSWIARRWELTPGPSPPEEEG